MVGMHGFGQWSFSLNSNSVFDVGSLDGTQPSLAKREGKRKKNCGGYWGIHDYILLRPAGSTQIVPTTDWVQIGKMGIVHNEYCTDDYSALHITKFSARCLKWPRMRGLVVERGSRSVKGKRGSKRLGKVSYDELCLLPWTIVTLLIDASLLSGLWLSLLQ